MIGDLQPGEVVVAGKIDRISQLPLPEAERLMASIYPIWRTKQRFWISLRLFGQTQRAL